MSHIRVLPARKGTGCAEGHPFPSLSVSQKGISESTCSKSYPYSIPHASKLLRTRKNIKPKKKARQGVLNLNGLARIKNWWAHQDLNLGRAGYEPAALPTEL